jgi:hypothetical protein
MPFVKDVVNYDTCAPSVSLSLFITTRVLHLSANLCLLSLVDNDRYPMKLVKGGQMTLVFQHEPKATHFDATLLHPLKRAEDFYRFHKQ